MVYSILKIILCESKGITLGNTINDEKKELIKENLKIKNQLQMVSTQYENMKRIHDSLLDEYLDLQVNNNFDKITIFQNEANQLNAENTRLIDELISLKEELTTIQIKEKEQNERVEELQSEKENLELKLQEKDEYNNNLNIKFEETQKQRDEFERIVNEISSEKESYLEQNSQMKNKIEELDKIIDNLKLEQENENRDKNQKIEELNNQLLSIGEQRETIERIEAENKEFIELLQTEIDEKNEEKEKLQLKLSSLEEKAEETKHYVEAMQEELAKAFDVARINTELLEEKENHLLDLEEKLKLKKSEYQELKDELEQINKDKKTNEEKIEELNIELSSLKGQLEEKEEKLNEIINVKEDIESDRNEKAEYLNELQIELEKVLEELRISKENLVSLESGEINSLKEENEKLKQEIIEKEELVSLVSNELENLKTEKNDFEQKIINNNDIKEEIIKENRELKTRVEEIQKELEEKELNLELILEEKDAKINELNVCIEELNEELEMGKDNDELLILKEQLEETCNQNTELSESYEKLNNDFVRTVHKNYDFKLMTANMLGKVLEENDKLNKELKRIKVHMPIKETNNMKVNDYYEEPRVDIKNLFGNDSDDRKDRETCIISSFINGLEDRNEFHPEEKIGKVIWTEGVSGLRDENEMIHSDNSSENPAISEEDKIEKIGVNFVNYKEFFSREKVEEYLDFVKFMLPRAIEGNTPLLEKEMLYFSVSFAFYFYNGGDFWELLLNKLEIEEQEKEKYRYYLRKELDIIFKRHQYCQLVDESGERVGASIVMQSILPVRQMNDYLNSIKELYFSSEEDIMDKNTFEKALEIKIRENELSSTLKTLYYLNKSNNIDYLTEYSYEIIKEIDAKNQGIVNENSNLSEVVIKKIHSMF